MDCGLHSRLRFSLAASARCGCVSAGPSPVLLYPSPAQKPASCPNRWKPRKPLSLPFQGTKNAITFSLVEEELIKSLIGDRVSAVGNGPELTA